MNLKDTFEKIYCINLDRRTDRWDESIEEFKKWGWKMTFNVIQL